MKKILLFTIVSMSVTFGSAQFVPSGQGSSVVFKIRNFGFEVTGKFTDIRGRIHFDPQNAASDSFDIVVAAASINTDNNLRDSHLKGEGYFDIANYPDIHFISTGITVGTNKGMYLLTGRLTIKNIVREIKFPFVATADGEGYVLKGSFKIKRKDFNVGGTSTIADELEVLLDVQAKKA
jgi:polyisoprenoid-binding protein YceI